MIKIMGIKLTDKQESEKYLNSTYGNSSLYDGMNHIGVSVVEEKDGKVKERYVESDTLLGATRIMNTWIPTRGWEVIQFRVEEVGRLF
jgi:hypothetical protein